MTGASLAIQAGAAALLLVANYYVTTLAIWIGHYWPHRPNSRMRAFHLGGHHALYPNSRQARSTKFVYGRGRHDSLVPLLPWLLLVLAIQLLVLSRWFVPMAAVETVVVAALHSYVHSQFHLAASPLDGLAWFRRGQARHDIHHDEDLNFMVLDHFWDRVFRTYKAAPAEN